MYGAKPGDGSFASNCLLARRLAERGVRFIQLYHRDWDHHSGIKTLLPANCAGMRVARTSGGDGSEAVADAAHGGDEHRHGRIGLNT